jgi:Stf0 sulfotransferase
MLPQAVGFSGNPTTESYLIYTTHRSGSNLLCQVLTDSKVAGKPGEFFSDKLRARLTGLLSLPENLTPIEFFRGAMRRTTGPAANAAPPGRFADRRLGQPVCATKKRSEK